MEDSIIPEVKDENTIVEHLKEKKNFLVSPSLTNIDLSARNLDDDDILNLAKVLEGTQSLQSLNLYGNDIQLVGLKSITELLKRNSSITTLNLGFSNISEEGSKCLAEVFKVNSHIHYLNLGRNEIGPVGMKYLSSSFYSHNGIVSLLLGGNDIEDFGVKALARSLLKNGLITTLDLNGNMIGDEGAKFLSFFLKTSASLTTLNLSDNKIGNDGMNFLSIGLSSNTSVTTLHIEKNNISVIPAVFGESRIKVLHIRYNKIETLPNSMSASVEQLFIYGNPLKKAFLMDNDNEGKKLIKFLLDSYQQSTQPLKKVRFIIAGDSGVGKTTLLKAFEREKFPFFFRDKMASTEATIGIESYPSSILGLTDGIDYQVMEFAGSMQYRCIHQYLLSRSESIYILTISLGREIKPQINNWFLFFLRFFNFKKTLPFIFVVATKSDIIIEKSELDKKIKRLSKIILEYKKLLQDKSEIQKNESFGVYENPIVVSNVDLKNVGNLKKLVSLAGQRLIKNIPNHVMECREDYLSKSKTLIIEIAENYPKRYYEVFHDIGEIVFRDMKWFGSGYTYSSIEDQRNSEGFIWSRELILVGPDTSLLTKIFDFVDSTENLKCVCKHWHSILSKYLDIEIEYFDEEFYKPGLICTNPTVLGKVMSLFINVESSTLEKAKRPTNGILSIMTVENRILSFLETHYPEYKNETYVKKLLLMMEQLDFAVILQPQESLFFGYENAILFPSLSKSAKFRLDWHYPISPSPLTIGRRVSIKSMDFIFPFRFWDLQVSFIRIYRGKFCRFPMIYSNGLYVQFHQEEILCLLPESSKHVDIIIRGKNPHIIWNDLQTQLFNSNILVQYHRPEDIFKSALNQPLVFEAETMDEGTLNGLSVEERGLILLGSSISPQGVWPWTLPKTPVISPDGTNRPLVHQFMALKSTVLWEESIYKPACERITKLFNDFVGVEGIKKWKIEKLQLIDNPKAEAQFLNFYISKKRNPSFKKWVHESNESVKQQQQILINQMFNTSHRIAGDEGTGLTLAWFFGDVRELEVINLDAFPYVSDGSGMVKKGFSFTNWNNFGETFLKYREKKGTTTRILMLCWILPGNSLPVTNIEQVSTNPLSDFDSIYMLLKKEKKTWNFSPYSPATNTLPDLNEIVLNHPHQILPQCLLHYSYQTPPAAKHTILWVDPNPKHNKPELDKIEKSGINIIKFRTTEQIIKWLNSKVGKNKSKGILKNLKVISNRDRKGDGEETAGVRLCQWLKQKGSHWADVPFMLYCFRTEMVKDLPKLPGVFLTSNPDELFAFATGNKG